MRRSGCPDRCEGPHRDRGHPHDVLLSRVRRLRPGLRHRGGSTAARGGLRDPREDEHAGVRDGCVHRVGAERRDPEPVEHGAHARRLERRSRGRAGGRAGTDRPRNGRRRLDPHSRLMLRRLRAEALSRARLERSVRIARGALDRRPALHGRSRTPHTCSTSLAGYEPGDPWWAPPPERPFAESASERPARLRIAVTSTPPIDVPVDPECVAALDSAAALLAELGHDVREETPPWRESDLFDKFIAVWQVGPALYPIDDALMTPLNRGLVASARETLRGRLRTGGRVTADCSRDGSSPSGARSTSS